MAALAPLVWRMAKLDFADFSAAACVLAQTIRTGVTNRRKAEEPSWELRAARYRSTLSTPPTFM